jgi:hypothetical protein
MLGKIALCLISLAERYADSADREWIAAMRAEFDVIDSGLAQLRWAAGAVRLILRPYRGDFLRLMLCIAAVVVANYTYPKFATARTVELFFFAQQLYLPFVGILAANSTRRVLVGTVHGTGVSLLGLAVLHALGYGTPDASGLPAIGGASIYVDVLFFALVGAALGTAAAAVVRFPRNGPIRGLPQTPPAAPDRQ